VGPVPPSLHGHAADDLRFIRAAMARSSTFTAVPGWGGIWMGCSAIVTAIVTGPPGSPHWLAWWLLDAVLAATVGTAAVVRKVRRSAEPLPSAVVRRFVFAFLPSALVGAALTPVLAPIDAGRWLPGCWLLTYGAAIASAGAYSIRLVPIVGVSFMALGVVALVAPPTMGHWLLAIGFGALQITFGWVVARRHGG